MPVEGEEMRKIWKKIAAWFRLRSVPTIGAGEYVQAKVREASVIELYATGVGYIGFEDAVKHKAAVDIAEVAIKSGLIRFDITPVEEIPGWITVKAVLKVVENT